LQEIETLQHAAQEEGFAAGYQEGRKEGREQGYQKGHQEGHADGYQKGFTEGLAAAQEEIKIRVEKLELILDFLSQPLTDLDALVEEELAYLATEIARQLVRRELKAAPGEIVAVVRETVSLLPLANHSVRVHLHPEDARLVREVLALHETESSWHLIEDHTLTRGGCIVNTDMSRIDASVEKRLGAVIATVLGDERGQHGHSCA
jgi:flagellar assembly protein FliH